jgi:ABC-type branched-subunit amino acid transport system substrate-binding protein
MRQSASALLLASLFLAVAARAEPGVTDGRIVIGQSIGLSGPVAAVAQDIAAGLGAYVHHANKTGGINGRQLELKTMDDGFAPPRTGENTRALVGTSFLLAAPLGTPHTAELLKASGPAGVPAMCPFTGAERLRAEPNHFLFHVRAGYKDEILKMVEQLTTLGINRIALFYQNDPFGEEGLVHLESALQQRNLKLAGRATYERGSVDVSAAVKALAAADPQAIIMFAVTRPAGELVKRMQEAGKFPQFLTISTNANDDFIKALAEHKRGVGNTQVAPYPWNTSMPLVKEYQQAMRDTGRQQFSFNSLEAYVCGKVIGEGLRRASRNLTRERFIEALETMKRYDAGGYEISYSAASHAGSRHVDLTVIDGNGKFLR